MAAAVTVCGAPLAHLGEQMQRSGWRQQSPFFYSRILSFDYSLFGRGRRCNDMVWEQWMDICQ
jgi:hypothetical protein